MSDLPPFPREWPESVVRVAALLWRVQDTDRRPVTMTAAEIAAQLSRKEHIGTRTVEKAIKYLSDASVLVPVGTVGKRVARRVEIESYDPEMTARSSALSSATDDRNTALSSALETALETALWTALSSARFEYLVRSIVRDEVRSIGRRNGRYQDIESDHARAASASASATAPPTPHPDTDKGLSEEPAGGGEIDFVPDDPGTEPFHGPDADFAMPTPPKPPAPKPIPDGEPWSGDLRDPVGLRSATIWLRAWGAAWHEADADRIASVAETRPAKHVAQCLWHDFSDGVKSRVGLLRAMLEGRADPDRPREALVRWGSLPPPVRAAVCPLDVGGTDIALARIEYAARRDETARKDADAMTTEQIAAEAAALKERPDAAPRPEPEPRRGRRKPEQVEAETGAA